jgi:hypothetical protein
MKRVKRCRRRRISSFFGIFQSFVMFSLLLLRGTVRLTVSGSGHGLDRGRQYKAGGDIARTQARLCSCCRWTWTWHHQAKRGLPACPSRKRTSTGRAEWLLFGGNSGSFFGESRRTGPRLVRANHCWRSRHNKDTLQDNRTRPDLRQSNSAVCYALAANRRVDSIGETPTRPDTARPSARHTNRLARTAGQNLSAVTGGKDRDLVLEDIDRLGRYRSSRLWNYALRPDECFSFINTDNRLRPAAVRLCFRGDDTPFLETSNVGPDRSVGASSVPARQ